ncbi:MAG: cupin domain-containing protein [Myxococcota bacterium]
MESLALEPFWSDFVDRLWSQRPGVMRTPLTRPMLTAKEAFDALVQGAKRPDQFRARFYVDDRQLESGKELGLFMPRASDRSLAGYARRLDRLSEGRPHGVIFNDLTRHHVGAWRRVRTFLRGFYGRVGLPVCTTDTALFLGNYGATPGGIHRDFTDTMAFAVKGHKQMLVWDDDYFPRPGVPTLRTRAAAEATEYQHDAETLTLGTRDLAYWPRNAWHVATADGGLGASFSIGIMHRTLATHLERTVSGMGVPPTMALPADADGQQAPPELTAPLDRLAEVLASGALHRDQLHHWLRVRTAGGVLPAPWAFRKLAAADVIAPQPDLWLERAEAGDALIVAANGYSFELPDTRGARWLLRWLQRREPRSVQEVLRKAARVSERGHFNQFLHVLGGASAIAVQKQ